MRRAVLVPVALVGALAVAPAAAQAQVDHPATRAAVARYVTVHGPGAAVYAGNSNSSWFVTAGYANPVTRTAIGRDGHIRAASQTKAFTAVTVLKLVQTGQVSLDTPIARYLPGVVTGNGYDENAITVRQLLRHQSGTGTTYVPNPAGAYTLAQLVRYGLDHTPPQFTPGTGYYYSNIGYNILGLLIEEVTGKPYRQAITEATIQPLGLTRTSFPAQGDATLPAPYVPGYLGYRFGPVYFFADTTSTPNPAIFATAGSLTTSLPDLATFQRALNSGQLLPPALLAEMRSTVPIQPAYGDFAYGLGLLRIPLSCGGVAWGHHGDANGHTSVTMVTDDGRFAAVMANSTLNQVTDPDRFTVLDTALCEA
ncbi:serine hydrolase domain-containing protein [Actinokineospora bangkokensis]|uniref:serine hydrolase domain-containing protein n=1 Tax=Actinokineospora bangkokensis TaxID=1193682 RepID=UPI000B027966|nr:serine hydrolase domain-containing protein [Actinokineospora bangkokensis]